MKSKRAREFFKIVVNKYPSLPFTIGNFEDSIGARLGVSEADKHELIDEYPMLSEKGAIIA
jgi:hypothetical protein